MTRLLVSVSNEAEAAAALDGGADLIDAKDPANGALGAVSLTALEQIAAVVGGRRPLSAALGDAVDEQSVAADAHEFARRGCAFVKIGFPEMDADPRAGALLSAAVRGLEAVACGSCRVIAVAYADRCRPDSLRLLIPLAVRAAARGVLVDTSDKGGPGLLDLVGADRLAELIAEAHDAGLLIALAGRLGPDDLPLICHLGADVAGVRGAACDGGRSGRVVATQVRTLKALCDQSAERSASASPASTIATVMSGGTARAK